MQIKDLGRQAYLPVFEAMQSFTAERSVDTGDELWLVEHEPVFTQGLNGQPEHVLHAGDIPVIQTDRGGQVTYHGPGQLVLYCLFDLRRIGLGVRQMITVLEKTVISLFAAHHIEAHARADAPGVYVGSAKVAALGLRVRNGRCYHGLSLNIDMDLSPFQRINPCGYADMPVTDMNRLGIGMTLAEAKAIVPALFRQQLKKALNDKRSS